MKSFFPPLLFLAAGAVSVPAAEDGAPSPASDAAVAEIAAARERLMLKDGLRDVLARRAAFYAEAETLSENERSRRASDIASRFETLLSRFPESAPALFCFAEFLRDGGETARAEELLLRAEKTDPDFAAAQFLLGEILAAGKSPEKAFPRFSAAVRTAPDAADFHLGFGEYLTDFREVLLEKGIFNDENGQLSSKMKSKIFEMLGMGNWESAQDLNELHIKKAGSENLKMLDGINCKVSEIDQDALHINEHIAFMLGSDYEKMSSKNSNLERLFLEHIRAHKQKMEG